MDGAATVRSRTWDGGDPAVSVVVTTFRRPALLPGLLAALEAQRAAPSSWELVVVDNGSGDATWPVLVEAVASTGLRMLILKVEANRGPGGGRNAGAVWARARILAFTDDDCLPAPGWVSGIRDAFTAGVDLVQGRVLPEPGVPAGPWDHTVDVSTVTPWAETCNVAYRRTAFDAVGGFDEADPLTARAGGRSAFGEDALLGSRVVGRGGGRRFAAAAVVHHRIVPGSWVGVVREWRNCAGFPGLARRSQLVARSLHLGIFLTRDTARFDLAVTCVLVASAIRQPVVLVGAIPWVRRQWSARRSGGVGRLAAVRLVGQRAVVEAVGLGSLIEGSVRHRRLVL